MADDYRTTEVGERYAQALFDLALDTGLDWARLKAPRQEQWTIDGAPLNQLIIISRIKPGEHIFLGARERRSP